MDKCIVRVSTHVLALDHDFPLETMPKPFWPAL
jgi:hypothetical protein